MILEFDNLQVIHMRVDFCMELSDTLPSLPYCEDKGFQLQCENENGD